MRIAKNLFIKRPMKWQYILSIVMEIPVFIWFIRNIPQVLWQWGVMIGYIIISFIYYIINSGDMIYYSLVATVLTGAFFLNGYILVLNGNVFPV
ncbi:Uncharacterised protein [Streptococcus suis]|uniref:Uncharacterized protein n=1 Tax=Streptococcus suis TaxID=1307 RepID=A0A822W5B9_STRSU|nr:MULTISPECIES: hypothetical protein [Lactobacillales]CYY12836.1 Uncharacterised protein [Streptococcus suis]CYY19562.1 Uncharacterised protein [Streptococcus suis]CYY32720.1 Uncharacterised protein [Streptococcus suis]CYY35045.1 Uncharacterised protein [Streptococcus suis]CYY35329.1 Uncharacterised protein [Streptococcus suis]